MNVTGPYWWLVNIGAGNGLVPSGNKPLPEPMLTQISVVTWLIYELKLGHAWVITSHSFMRCDYLSMPWTKTVDKLMSVNTLRPRQHGRHFADNISKSIFLNENVRILNEISPKFVPKGLISNIPTLDQIMAWCRLGDNKPLSEPVMA